MALNLGELSVDIRADTSGMRRAEHEVRQSSNNISRALKTIAIGYLTSEVVQLGISAIKTADKLATMERSLERLVGGSVEAANAMQKLTETANAAGISTEEAAQIFARFAASKEELGATNEELLLLTDNLAKMGAIG